MVHILHISDLHIVEGANWNNMRYALIEEAKKKVQNCPENEKMLVITGDFHNFNDDNYDHAKHFLTALAEAMDIRMDLDVFVVPGNHDIGNKATMNRYFPDNPNWDLQQSDAVQGMIQGKDHRYFKMRMDAFLPYVKFVRELGIYPIDGTVNPAGVHVRNWRGKLNLLHLNTAIVADGSNKKDQLVDIDIATSEEIWKDIPQNVPTIALGHNSFYDLLLDHQNALEAVFLRCGVQAYWCGDRHKEEKNKNEEIIRLKSGFGIVPHIPNIVCIKSAVDQNDTYSDFGFCWHEWDETANIVSVKICKWDPKGDQSTFVSSNQLLQYSMKGQFLFPTMSPEVKLLSGIERELHFFSLAPNFQQELVNLVQHFIEIDRAIHTPQILALLLEYPGCRLRSQMNRYKLVQKDKTKCGVGDFLHRRFSESHLQEEWPRFDFNINMKELLNLECAQSQLEKEQAFRKQLNYISADVLAYAVLSKETATIQYIRKLLGKIGRLNQIKMNLLTQSTTNPDFV